MLLAVLVGGPATTAAATTEPSAREGAALLRWRAPAGCPDEVTVRARLVDALPPDVEAPSVEADVLAAGDGRFRATVVLRGSWGETTRRLDSPTCDTLADAVVLLAAVSVSSAAGEPEPPITEVPEPTPVEPEVEGEVTDVQPEPEPDPAGDPGDARLELEVVEPDPAERSWRSAGDALGPASGTPVLRGLARLEGRAGAGLLPVVDLGGAATLGLEHRWFRVELSGAGWLPRERTVAPDARVRASAWALELRACAALRPRPWLVVLPCAELDGGRLRGEGRGAGLVNGRVERQTWLALGVGPAVSFRLHRLVGVWLSATAVVPLLRPGLGLEGLREEAYRMAAFVGRGSLGLEVYFP
jgi:hypothetical protein